MGMENPEPTFSYLASQLKSRHPNLAYLHVIEPRIAADSDASAPDHASNDFLREIWAPKVLISAGGYTTQTALDTAGKNERELIAMGRSFLANVSMALRSRSRELY
jgi:NADPH2 dehydrogenase